MLKGKLNEANAALLASFNTASDALVKYARDIIEAAGPNDDYTACCDAAETGITVLIEAEHISEGSRRKYRQRISKALWLLRWQSELDETYKPPKSGKLFDFVKEYDSLYPESKPKGGKGKGSPKFYGDIQKEVLKALKERKPTAAQAREALQAFYKALPKAA